MWLRTKAKSWTAKSWTSKSSKVDDVTKTNVQHWFQRIWNIPENITRFSNTTFNDHQKEFISIQALFITFVAKAEWFVYTSLLLLTSKKQTENWLYAKCFDCYTACLKFWNRCWTRVQLIKYQQYNRACCDVQDDAFLPRPLCYEYLVHFQQPLLHFKEPLR